VGDNVGDCAGMAADVFESYEVTLVAAIILAAASLATPQFQAAYGEHSAAFALKLDRFPLIIRAVGVYASVLGTLSVRLKEGEQDPMRPIITGYWVSSLSALAGIPPWPTPFTCRIRARDRSTGASPSSAASHPLGDAHPLADQLLHAPETAAPVSETAIASKTGRRRSCSREWRKAMSRRCCAIMLIGGTILSCLWVFRDGAGHGFLRDCAGGPGLLTTTGFILAMDTYGPITDNAHGIFEMAEVQ